MSESLPVRRIRPVPARNPVAEVDTNPHSDLPAAGGISIEIPHTSGERSGVSPPSPAAADPATAAVPPLPFGVYRGTPANQTPKPSP
jgi:hypothetical protein